MTPEERLAAQIEIDATEAELDLRSETQSTAIRYLLGALGRADPDSTRRVWDCLHVCADELSQSGDVDGATLAGALGRLIVAKHFHEFGPAFLGRLGLTLHDC